MSTQCQDFHTVVEDYNDEAILGVYARGDTTRIPTNKQNENPPCNQTLQSEHWAIKTQRTPGFQNSLCVTQINRNGKTESKAALHDRYKRIQERNTI